MPTAKKKYITEPLNYCIYCGDSNTDCTDEHIIPAGLDGLSTLPKASCKERKDIWFVIYNFFIIVLVV